LDLLGQSNMEWDMSRFADAQGDIALAADSNLRFFTVPKNRSAKPMMDCQGGWESSNPGVVKTFSAASYYFGKELRERLNVPIGLINSSYGGSSIEAWMDWDGLSEDPDFAPIVKRARTQFAYQSDPERTLQQYQDDLVRWKAEADKADPLQAAILSRGGDFDPQGWDPVRLPLLDVAEEPADEWAVSGSFAPSKSPSRGTANPYCWTWGCWMTWILFGSMEFQ
jgi:sialate O-acetylesterase